MPVLTLHLLKVISGTTSAIQTFTAKNLSQTKNSKKLSKAKKASLKSQKIDFSETARLFRKAMKPKFYQKCPRNSPSFLCPQISKLKKMLFYLSATIRLKELKKTAKSSFSFSSQANYSQAFRLPKPEMISAKMKLIS